MGSAQNFLLPNGPEEGISDLNWKGVLEDRGWRAGHERQLEERKDGMRSMALRYVQIFITAASRLRYPYLACCSLDPQMEQH